MLVIFPMAGLSSFCNPPHKDPGHLLCDINSPLPSCKLEQWIVKWLGVPQGQGWCVIPEVWSLEKAPIHLFESALWSFLLGLVQSALSKHCSGSNAQNKVSSILTFPIESLSITTGNCVSPTGQESDQLHICLFWDLKELMKCTVYNQGGFINVLCWVWFKFYNSVKASHINKFENWDKKPFTGG